MSCKDLGVLTTKYPKYANAEHRKPSGRDGRKEGGTREKAFARRTQMDADEAGFFRIGVNMCRHFEARRGGPSRRRKNINKSIGRVDPSDRRKAEEIKREIADAYFNFHGLRGAGKSMLRPFLKIGCSVT